MSADSVAAKVAAGRRKLEEYKSKKKPELNTVDNNVVEPIMIPQPDVKKENDRAPTPIEDNLEMEKLRHQLKFHMQTVEYLVSEKNALAARIADNESQLLDVKRNNEDLSARLNISRHRASCLEMECSRLRERSDEAERVATQTREESAKFKQQQLSHTSQLEDIAEQLRESQSLAAAKALENSELIRQIQELNLRADVDRQLNGDVPNDASERNAELQRQLDDTLRQLKEHEIERNQSNSQYQQYVRQLNDQLESMSSKQEAILLENENLINREANLLQQMDSLEKQLQNRTHEVAPSSGYSNSDIEQLQNLSKEMENENLQLKVMLKEKDDHLRSATVQAHNDKNKIDDLLSTIQQLQAEKPDVVKLNAANESDRVAAQKAVAQNTKLKTELESLQEAYRNMTESKLELAELLQAEKNLSRNLTLTLADTEEKLNSTMSKLLAKDEEMIRLQAESSELEKQALKHAQIADRLNHYEAQDHSVHILQKELEMVKSHLKVITEENQNLKNAKSKTDGILQNGDVNLDESSVDNNHHTPISHNHDSVECDGELENHAIKTQVSDVLLKNETCIHLSATDAMKKLQDRFTHLMEDIACLSDDKQRLEHLVLQLQGETETIGEYIALYQKQRSILKQKEFEKDIQLNILNQEKEQIKIQFDQLNQLIEKLLTEKDTAENSMTGKTVIDLLSDMRSNSLINSTECNDPIEHFQPCPWCSGKLITI